MSVSSPFIHRPIATSLLGVAVMLGGFLGYWWLPVSALPQVDFPTIQVTTQLPGANPDTIAALVTAPLERQFGQIPALQTMTSSSSFGISQVTLQFDLNRDIDAAAQDVQSAINAAASTLPRNLPYPPLYSKVNPADAPVITLALTSQTIDLRTLSDMADTIMAPRLSEVTGLGAGWHSAGNPHSGRSVTSCCIRPCTRGSAHGHRWRQRCRTEGLARWRASVLHHRGKRPDNGRPDLQGHCRSVP
jgi:multidrug efflux pump